MKNILITAILVTAFLITGCKKTSNPPYVGTWIMNGVELQLNANNTYAINLYPNTETGTYTVTAASSDYSNVATQINLTATTSQNCRTNQVGSYAYAITEKNSGGFNPTDNGILTLSLISDPCNWRVTNLPGSYTLQSTP